MKIMQLKICSIDFCTKNPTDETNAAEHLFHVSNIFDVMPLQTMSEITNTKERFNTQHRGRNAKPDVRHIISM